MSATPTHKLMLGDQADRLLQNPAFVEGMRLTKRKYVDQMVNSEPTDTETREKAYIAIHVVQNLENELIEMVNQAKATRTLQEMEADGDGTT